MRITRKRRHYEMDEAAEFTFDDREYAVFTFGPTVFAERTDSYLGFRIGCLGAQSTRCA